MGLPSAVIAGATDCRLPTAPLCDVLSGTVSGNSIVSRLIWQLAGWLTYHLSRLETPSFQIYLQR